MTWDSMPTQVDANKHFFVILINTFREQTHQEWNDKYLESFGLVISDDKLTNAGLLFVDNCIVFQSRIFCTRWTRLYKDDAISSVEHRFYTTFYNLNWGENGRIPVEEVANRVNSTLERYLVKQILNKPVGRTAQRIMLYQTQ